MPKGAFVAAKKELSFMRSLCLGEIEQDIILPFPKVKESERDILKGIFDSVGSWLKDKEGDFRKWDRAGEMPPEFLKEMKELGLFSFIIPEEFGGLGLSSTGYSR